MEGGIPPGKGLAIPGLTSTKKWAKCVRTALAVITHIGFNTFICERVLINQLLKEIVINQNFSILEILKSTIFFIPLQVPLQGIYHLYVYISELLKNFERSN